MSINRKTEYFYWFLGQKKNSITFEEVFKYLFKSKNKKTSERQTIIV